MEPAALLSSSHTPSVWCPLKTSKENSFNPIKILHFEVCFLFFSVPRRFHLNTAVENLKLHKSKHIRISKLRITELLQFPLGSETCTIHYLNAITWITAAISMEYQSSEKLKRETGSAWKYSVTTKQFRRAKWDNSQPKVWRGSANSEPQPIQQQSESTAAAA